MWQVGHVRAAVSLECLDYRSERSRKCTAGGRQRYFVLRPSASRRDPSACPNLDAGLEFGDAGGRKEASGERVR
jgi:hypothetical protein